MNTNLLRKPLAFEGNFTQIPNTWVRDERLSFRAKGILLFLMSHRNGWQTSLQHLANESPDGITAIRTAIEQLQEYGYLVRTNLHGAGDWIINDPLENLMDEASNPSENLMGNSQVPLENLMGDPLENLMVNKTIIKTLIKKEYMAGFEKFWNVYPRKIGQAKALASYQKAMLKITEDELIAAVLRYAHSPSLPEMQYIPYPATWLNQERWGDVVEHSGGNATSTAIDIMKRSEMIQASMNTKSLA